MKGSQQCFVGVLIFFFIHLAGVLRLERNEYKSLVPAVIHGGEKAETDNRAGAGREKKQQRCKTVFPFFAA
jgi:hypothetical protein